MREIKFRAWDKSEKRFYQDVTAGSKLLILQYNYEDDEMIYWSDDHSKSFVIQQFIGVNAKNGKEVYDGDILDSKCVVGFDEVQLCYVTIWLTHYKKWIKSNKNIAVCGCTYTKITSNSKVAVIGNVYENPGLIK